MDEEQATSGESSGAAEREPRGGRPPLLDLFKLKKSKLGHRRVTVEGEVTFKKIQSSQIIGCIQLGIGHAIGGLANRWPERDLLMQDFEVVETTVFPKSGSPSTPAHRFGDFKFRAYAPVAFRHFRATFGIRPEDFLASLCGPNPPRQLTNPGASGSLFYVTYDDCFILKTVDHREAEFLRKLLPGYYMNVCQNPRTLLPKFFGLYCCQCGNKNVRLVIMNNLLPSVRLAERYDLKGSTYKRCANKTERRKPSPTYKDLDFVERHPDGFMLDAETHMALAATLRRDCRVLESFKIMDYSLLVGVHNLDAEEEGMPKPSVPGMTRLAAYSTAMESIRADVQVPNTVEATVPIGGIPARSARGDRLLLFLGIIDILQSFVLAKKLEHAFKAAVHDGDTVSVHRPGFYAHRFLQFTVETVFVPGLRTTRALSSRRRTRKASSRSDEPIHTETTDSRPTSEKLTVIKTEEAEYSSNAVSETVENTPISDAADVVDLEQVVIETVDCDGDSKIQEETFSTPEMLVSETGDSNPTSTEILDSTQVVIEIIDAKESVPCIEESSDAAKA
ncbi:hypothetical protein JTE90_003330 [Oedothorax gibbosus]|uniref:PIPK domain-containing protein n=1 Tax=Oedothorax gibbosus TaxID=931172 RepID=A0AAV6UEP6_9ARAC|nr:hypothetical protein JTE90_003330 [Oedothorax gibbosus]